MFETLSNLMSLDTALTTLQSLPWIWVIFFTFFITFLENIFPPSPSDVLLVVIGTLISFDVVGFFPLLIASTLGSSVGFILMYILGLNFGKKIIDSDKFPFITHKSLEKPEEWFRKYGFYIIIANRFLSGTRAVISFFAGISKLDLTKTTLLSTLSSAIWNTILLLMGMAFANNLDTAFEYISNYGKIIGIIIIIAIIGFLLRNRIKSIFVRG